MLVDVVETLRTGQYKQEDLRSRTFVWSSVYLVRDTTIYQWAEQRSSPEIHSPSRCLCLSWKDRVLAAPRVGQTAG